MEWKRIVRYMYEYENGRKIRNTGFVRFDVNEKVCRVYIHGRGIREEERCNIYAFYESDEAVIRIPLGFVRMQNHNLTGYVEVDCERVGGAPVSFDRILGLMIGENRQRRYMVFLKNERPLDTVYEEPGTGDAPAKEEDADGQLRQRESQSCPGADEAVPKAAPATPEADEAASAEGPGVDGTAPIEHQGIQEADGTAPTKEQGVQEADGTVPAGEQGVTEADGAVSAKHQEIPEAGATAPAESPAVSEAQPAQGEQMDSGMQTAQEGQFIPEEPSAQEEQLIMGGTSGHKERPGFGDSRTKPGAPEELLMEWGLGPGEMDLPPESEEHVEEETAWKRITPKDLAVLNRRDRHLVNNSFLLHGYYNFGHLLLGEEEERYILGVPGVLLERERRAAGMFGFPDFMKAEEYGLSVPAEAYGGRAPFGYWCRRLAKG